MTPSIILKARRRDTPTVGLSGSCCSRHLDSSADYAERREALWMRHSLPYRRLISEPENRQPGWTTDRQTDESTTANRMCVCQNIVSPLHSQRCRGLVRSLFDDAVLSTNVMLLRLLMGRSTSRMNCHQGKKDAWECTGRTLPAIQREATVEIKLRRLYLIRDSRRLNMSHFNVLFTSRGCLLLWFLHCTGRVT